MPASRRRGPRRASGRSVGDLHALARHGRAHAVQSGGRRDGEGSSGSGDRRARRADGARDRRDRHPVQAAEQQPRAGGLVAARAGGQAAVRDVGARRRSRREPNIHWIFGQAGQDSRRRRGASPAWRWRTASASRCRALVVTTGTFLNGLIHVGPRAAAGRPGGRAAVA